MYYLNFLFSLLSGFSTQTAVGALLFSSSLKKRPHFWARTLPLVIFCFGPTLFSTISGRSFYLLPIFFIGWFAYIFLAMRFLLSLLIWFCFDGPYLRILYYCAASHILQNLAYMICFIIHHTYNTCILKRSSCSVRVCPWASYETKEKAPS